jgi:hypothetical protein
MRFHRYGALAWSATAPLEATTATGGHGPRDGWMAPGLDVRIPATRLTLRGPASLPLAILWVFFDTSDWTDVEAISVARIPRVVLRSGDRVDRLELGPTGLMINGESGVPFPPGPPGNFRETR